MNAPDVSPQTIVRGTEESPLRFRMCAIVQSGIDNPATRLRFEQYRERLAAAGFDTSVFYVPYTDGGRRTFSLRDLLRTARRSDVVFVQRVLTWWLPALLRLAGTPFVFDFDDALHYVRQSQYATAIRPRTSADRARALYRNVVRGGTAYSSRKRILDRLLRRSSAVIAGNETLRQYAEAVGARDCHILPTAVAVDTMPVRRHSASDPVRIGWIGVPSNLVHLRMIAPAFEELAERYGRHVLLSVVSSRSIEGLPIATEFVPWSIDGESDAVMNFDIGIMPLQDDPFSRGKCAFKAIYCMGHGVPVVVSPVGMNSELVRHGDNGFLAESAEEWYTALTQLIDDPAFRERTGRAARRTVEDRYAASVIGERLIAVLLDTIRTNGGRRLAVDESLQVR